MSKSTLSTTFRKIDVDQYSENNFKDDDVDDIEAVQRGPDEKEIANLLNKSKQSEALKIALRDAPLTLRDKQKKESAFNLVMRILMSTKSSQIEEAISNLNNSEVDTLMKYIYRGFEKPNEGSSALLLSWHEKAFAVGGLGSIVRVLTDKNHV